MAKIKSFEDNLHEVDDIIRRLETGELELADSMKEYEKAVKTLKKATDQLEKAEGKILKVVNDGEIKFEEFNIEK